MKRYLPFAIVAAVGIITAVAGTMLYLANRSIVPQLANADVPEANRAGETMHVLGPAAAPVTIEEFGDFQCPPCGKLAPVMPQLVKQFQPKVRLVFRELPLPVHTHAREAACAAEAAGLQGKFWQMHELLYREQAAWSAAGDARPLFTGYAEMVGLNLERFRRDLDGAEVKARVDADKQRATAVGATLTPTIFVNGRQVPGPSLNPEGLRAAIEQAVAEPPKRD